MRQPGGHQGWRHVGKGLWEGPAGPAVDWGINAGSKTLGPPRHEGGRAVEKGPVGRWGAPAKGTGPLPGAPFGHPGRGTAIFKIRAAGGSAAPRGKKGEKGKRKEITGNIYMSSIGINHKRGGNEREELDRFLGINSNKNLIKPQPFALFWGGKGRGAPRNKTLNNWKRSGLARFEGELGRGSGGGGWAPTGAPPFGGKGRGAGGTWAPGGREERGIG